MVFVLVSVERFAHIQSILSVFGHPRRIVRVVPDDLSISRVAHAFIHLDGVFVALSNKQIDKPSILLVACLLE